MQARERGGGGRKATIVVTHDPCPYDTSSPGTQVHLKHRVKVRLLERVFHALAKLRLLAQQPVALRIVRENGNVVEVHVVNVGVVLQTELNHL